MAKPAKPAPAAAGAAKPKNNKLLIIGIAVAVLVMAGGAGWYFTKGDEHKDKNKAKVEAEAAETPSAGEPKFIPLEAFTVNLQKDDGDQFLQIGITLKVSEPKLEEKLKLLLPEIRSRLLLLLSSKHASELITSEGKVKLAQEVIMETEAVLGITAPPPATSVPTSTQAVSKTTGRVDVLFTSFIIQ